MSQELVKQNIVWIDTDAQLEQVCEKWNEETLLAVDTEFMRSQTYYPIPGLIQVNDGKQNYLVDPTKIKDFYPLIDIFDNEKVLKVLHSCSEDLEVFQYAFGCLPTSLLDTQIAAAMAGFGFSLGFANLVNATMEIELPKGETRSDWLRRPLSVAQEQYAAMDVEYLFQVTTKLIHSLKQLDRLEWALEESRLQVRNYYDNQNCDNVHLRIKSAWKLNSRQLAVLQGLCRWREDKAQDKNQPRNRIIKEPAIMTIAQNNIEQVDGLRSVEGMNDRMVREYGEQIVKVVKKANDIAQVDLPKRLPKPLGAAERDVLQQLKARVADVGEQMKLPVEMLVRKKDYEQLINSAKQGHVSPPTTFNGWRKELIGDELVKLVAKSFDAEC